jgi:hypothetical protein
MKRRIGWKKDQRHFSLLYLLRHLQKGNARIWYRFFHRIPFRRICLSGKKFMPTVVNPQYWKQSLLPFLFCHSRIASGEIILLTDNELLAFTWGSRTVKTERLYQFWSQIFTSFPSTVEHLPRRSTTLAELADDLSHGFLM